MTYRTDNNGVVYTTTHGQVPATHGQPVQTANGSGWWNNGTVVVPPKK